MEKPRALIIGARGFLGAYLVEVAKAHFDVVRGQRFSTDSESIAIDITDAHSVRRAFESVQPDAVLLLAAMADIDRCEAEPARAFVVNVRGAEIVANECARANTRFLFTSTAAVFDGSKHGYREEDSVCPLSVYGITKAQAETSVRGLVPLALIVRFSLVIGFAKDIGTNSALDALTTKWKAKIPVLVPTFEFRNPIHAGLLSSIIVQLMTTSARGVFHVGASDSMSRYDVGRRIAALAGFSEELVTPQDEPIPGRAPRGKDHFLLSDKVEKLCGIKIPGCEHQIARCFNDFA